MRRSTRQQVRTRAGGRCEYCRLPDRFDPLPFHVDHVISRQNGGKAVMSNLAWACSYCNAHKGPNVAGIDPGTGAVTPLFNPRAQRWEDHFVWSQASAVGITPVGRTTIAILAINHPLLLKQRAELIAEGLFGS